MNGFWVSQQKIQTLPITGAAWTAVKAAADRNPGPTSLSDQESGNNVLILAKALVYARTGDTTYRDKVVGAINDIVTKNLEKGSRALALGRELVAYIIAADLIKLAQVNPALDTQFRAKLEYLRTAPMTGGPHTLVESNEKRPNNWGTHAGASRLAIALYLDNTAEIDKVAKIFKGWLGDRSSYAGFTYGELDWQPDPAHPVGICPVGAMLNGHNVDGALPEELRRNAAYSWPPKAGKGRMYSWEALQGALVQAQMLSNAGYDAWNWCDRALLRAAKFLYGLGWAAEGDDGWQPWLLNSVYGTTFPTTPSAEAGKNMGWTQWTNATAEVTPPKDGGGDTGGGNTDGGNTNGGSTGGDTGGNTGSTDTTKLADVLTRLTEVKGVLQQVLTNVDDALKAGQ